MHSFTDKESRKWEVFIDFVVVEQLREASEPNRFDLLDHAAVIESITDSTKIFRLLWALVEEQAAKHDNITARQFSALLVPCFKDARDALLSEIRDFFLSCQSPDKALAVEEMRIVAKEATEQFEAEAEKRLAGIRNKGSELIRTKLQSSFGNLEASLDKMSKPEDAPGESSTTPRTEPAAV